jgi:hypothetical protein
MSVLAVHTSSAGVVHFSEGSLCPTSCQHSNGYRKKAHWSADCWSDRATWNTALCLLHHPDHD